MFAISGERLTLRMRVEAFRAMLKQEMAWFDHPSNSTGNLCARLAGDASILQGVSVSCILLASKSLVIK